jgi:SAM-dependent methyltransferase
MSTVSEAFRTIYERHSWGGKSKSGPGSDPNSTRHFRRALARFMREHKVRSVVDLGCGDWASSRLIDWSGIDYLGLDAVPEVVERNQRAFRRPGIRFAVADITTDPLPEADLAICKEVLQHLPSDAVNEVLRKLTSFQWAILVNDDAGGFVGDWRTRWKGRPFEGTNADIEPGSYRPLALQQPPFNLNARLLTQYWNRTRELKWHKEVLVWTNPGRS